MPGRCDDVDHSEMVLGGAEAMHGGGLDAADRVGRDARSAGYFDLCVDTLAEDSEGVAPARGRG